MRFIVSPRHAQRQIVWEVIDLAPKGDKHEQADRSRIGSYADEDFARSLAKTLDGAANVLDAECEDRKQKGSF